MALMRELFFQLYAYVLLVEQTVLQREAQPSYEEVRSHIRDLLEQQEAEAKRQGLSEQDAHEARFAFMAWADEILSQLPGWEHQQQWSTHPLQLEYYQTRNAGEEFFERLEQLRGDQQYIREMYYLCLGLGFSGRYYRREDEQQRNRIRREQAPHLPQTVEDLPAVTRFIAQPYQVIPPPVEPIKPPLTALLLKAGLALLVLVPLVLFLVYMWTPDRTPPVETIVSPEPTVQEVVAAHRKPCTLVTIVQVQDAVVTLAGHVTSDVQRDELRQALLQLQGITTVNDERVRVLPWPLCEVVELLTPLHTQAQTQRLGLSLQLNKGREPTYFHHENLIVDIRTPQTFASYVYVDYYTADKSVGHLLPNAKELKNSFPPNSVVTVGRPDGPQPWVIYPPFGLELVTVIASPTPLFSPARLEPEPAKDYLQVLRQALEQASASGLGATLHFLTTQERP
jgi:type IV/VI secretion system ImpK/VasF family protein